MKRVAIIQARMTSSRLPGKVLRDLAGRPMLAQQMHRIRSCASVDEIVIATTTNPEDDPVVDLARREGVRWFRGSEKDVLSRFVGAAAETRADVIVRITADCPLIDPGVMDRVIDELTAHADECDYASNVLKRTYPRGLDAEAFFIDTLLRIDRLAKSQLSREHVTIVPRSERSDLFLIRSIEDESDNSDLRWTVDTPADLEMVGLIYSGLGIGERIATYHEILAHVRNHPQISRLNSDSQTWNPH